MKKSEKILKNRMMTIDELQKDTDGASDNFQVNVFLICCDKFSPLCFHCE